MKSLVIALTLFAGVFAQAECFVESARYPELQYGINKETICREVTFALESSYSVKAADFDVVILANGYRTTYNVQLEVLLKKNKKAVYRAEAVLGWWPGGDVEVEFKK